MALLFFTFNIISGYKMISNLLALACLPFWGDRCVIPNHETFIREAIVAIKRQLRCRQQGQEGLKSLAWDLDAARYTNFEGPARCTCIAKEELNALLRHLYEETPQVDCVNLIWALHDAWDAPTPDSYTWEISEFC